VGINFQTGSNAINGSTKDFVSIYNLLVQAEQAKLKLDIQIILVIPTQYNFAFKGRANSVAFALFNK
jgi:hypothetical protein